MLYFSPLEKIPRGGERSGEPSLDQPSLSWNAVRKKSDKVQVRAAEEGMERGQVGLDAARKATRDFFDLMGAFPAHPILSSAHGLI